MRKFFYRTGLKVTALSLLFVTLILTGCATRPVRYSAQSFGAAGAEADVYIFAPVQGNEPLLKTLFTAFVPEKTAAQYLSRTSALYIGLQYGGSPAITVASAGAYPVSMAGVLFSKKDGWEKRRSAGKDALPYYHSEAADIVMQSGHLAFALLGDTNRDTEAFLQRIAAPQQPVFPPRFQALIESGLQGSIGLYARSGSKTAAALFGLQDIELPIRSIELYLKKNTEAAEESYRYSAVFEAANIRAAFILKTLIGNLITGALSVQGTSIFAENADINETELITLLQGVFNSRMTAAPHSN